MSESKRLSAYSIFKTASSIRLTLVLFALVALLSLIAVIIPHGDRLFHAIPFKVLLAATALNLVSCLLIRVFRNFYKSVSFSAPINLPEWSALSFVNNWKNMAGEEKSDKWLKDELHGKGYCVKHVMSQDGIFYAARKGAISLWGSLVLHASVLVLGVTAWLSYTTDVTVVKELAPGDTIRFDKSTFGLRLDSFVVEHTDEGRVKSYVSYVTVLDNGDSVKTAQILVNTPLVVDNWFVYQSSYGALPDTFSAAAVEIKSGETLIDTEFVAAMNTRHAIDNSGAGLIVDEFYCSFTIDRTTNKATNRSMDHDNPAFAYRIVDSAGKVIESGWSFPMHPDFHGMGKSDFLVSVNDYLPVHYSSFQIRQHTGDSVIIASMALISIGLLLIFFIPYRILFMRLDKESITIGGRCSRYEGLLDRDIAEIKKSYNEFFGG